MIQENKGFSQVYPPISLIQGFLWTHLWPQEEPITEFILEEAPDERSGKDLEILHQKISNLKKYYYRDTLTDKVSDCLQM